MLDLQKQIDKTNQRINNILSNDRDNAENVLTKIEVLKSTINLLKLEKQHLWNILTKLNETVVKNTTIINSQGKKINELRSKSK